MDQKVSIMEVAYKPAWNPLYAVALGVSGLITSEFLPVGILTAMAKDLGITERLAGQALSVTALVAMASGLLTATLRINRRWLLLAFCLLQIVSNLMVAVAPDFISLMAGRVLLGIGIGGFWSLAPSIAMRLVPQQMVPKALTIVFGAVSVATVIASQMGSYVDAQIGWRNVFFIASIVGALALIWQTLTLPSLPSTKPVRLSTLLHVLKRPNIKAGILASNFVFMGYATFFTYLRPFLETVTYVNENSLTTILLVFGIANFAGTTIARHLLALNIHHTLTIAPFLMSVIIASLVLFGHISLVASVLVAWWGLFFGVVQVGWPAWLTQTVPDEAESGGSVQIVSTQLAITAGAVLGGILFDFSGAKGVYICSSIITLIAAFTTSFTFKTQNWISFNNNEYDYEKDNN